MKKVLIISYSYPPSQAPAAQRPFYLAKYLNKEIWEVHVVTPKFSDSSMGHDKNIVNQENLIMHYTNNLNISSFRSLKSSSSSSTFEVNNKTKFMSLLKTKIYKFISSITIPDKGAFWIPYGLKNSYNLIKKEKLDAIFTTSPLFSNHLIGLFLKKIFKVTWVVDFRDFHYVENYQNSKLLRRYLDKWMEKSVIKNADKVIFIAESMKNEYAKYYKELNHKGYAVYNGFELEKKFELDTLPFDKPLTIFYAGSFYAGERSPFPLLELLDKMIIEKKITIKELQIKIAGNIEEDLKNEMKKYDSFKAIKFLGIIQRSEVLSEIRKAHLLLLIVGDTKKHYMGFPIKGYEYIAAQRNILAFLPKESEAENIISSYNLGYILYNQKENTSKKNIETIKQVINDYKNKKLNNPLKMADSILQLTKENQFKKIEKLLSDIK
jgi:glycosyltransferase involved in cell wall biosynthesis